MYLREDDDLYAHVSEVPRGRIRVTDLEQGTDRELLVSNPGVHNHAFSNEFVVGEKIVSKSESFRAVTAGLIAKLRNEFVSWRGPHCFDNPAVNVGIFGDRFRRRAAAKKRTLRWLRLMWAPRLRRPRVTIGDFDISPDGRDLLFDRSRDESDIVLI